MWLFSTQDEPANECGFFSLPTVCSRLWHKQLPIAQTWCHEPSGYAFNQQQIGIGKVRVEIDDFEHTDAVFVFRSESRGTNILRMLENTKRSS